MLPSPHRLTAPTDFREVVRRGRRQGRSRLVVHLKVPTETIERPVTAGFVVSKAVGGAVVRNQVKRRLRHLVAERLAVVPAGSQLVVRALPPAASSSYDELGHDLDAALGRLTAGPPVRTAS